MPYGWTFAILCVLQGALVACGRRISRYSPRSSWIGIAVPVVALIIGVALTQSPGFGSQALVHLATFGTPVAAAASCWLLGRNPWASLVAAPILYVVAWQADGYLAQVSAVALVGGACLSLAALIAMVTPPRAIAMGLVILAIVDSVLIIRGHVATSAATIHATETATVGGEPLPALQDLTLGDAVFGWLDALAPALAGMLFVGYTSTRLIAGGATAAAALVWGLVLAVTSPIPGTVPPLVAVAIWLVATRRPDAKDQAAGSAPSVAPG